MREKKLSHFLLTIGEFTINLLTVPTIGYIYDIHLFVWSVDERLTNKAEYFRQKILAPIVG